MDRLEKQLRESSNQTRHFEPPPGQWDTIKDRLAQAEAGAANSDSTAAATGSSSGGGSLLNWSSGFFALGVITLGLASWFLLFPAADKSNDKPVVNRLQLDRESSTSASAELTKPSLASPDSQTDLTTPIVETGTAAANLRGPVSQESEQLADANSSDSVPLAVNSNDRSTASNARNSRAATDSRSDAAVETDEAPAATTSEQQADQAFNSPGNPALSSAGGGERPLPLSMDLSANSDIDATVSSRSISAPELAAYPLLAQQEPSGELIETVSLQAQLNNHVLGLSPMPIPDFQDSGFNHRKFHRSFKRIDASPRWEGSLHIASFPLGNYSSSSLYSNQFIEGTATLNTIFDGDPITLYRVNSNDVGQQNSAWFSSVHIDLSRRFRNGFRIGAGLGYYGTDLFRSGLNDNSFGAPDETVFVRYGSDQGSIYLADITAEYLFLRRHRFRFSAGVSLLIPLVLTDRYNDRIVQPATGIEEELSSVSYSYNFIGETHPVLLPQIGFEYQLGRRTTLSLSAGVRFGIGLRYNWLSGPLGE